MQTLFVNTTTTGTTPATVINSDARAIVVRKIIVGNPVSAGNIILFNENNALANNTTQIAYKHTFPTFSATNVNGTTPVIVDFRTSAAQGGSVADDGIFCPSGGSISIDQAMQVSVFWDYAEG